MLEDEDCRIAMACEFQRLNVSEVAGSRQDVAACGLERARESDSVIEQAQMLPALFADASNSTLSVALIMGR